MVWISTNPNFMTDFFLSFYLSFNSISFLVLYLSNVIGVLPPGIKLPEGGISIEDLIGWLELMYNLGLISLWLFILLMWALLKGLLEYFFSIIKGLMKNIFPFEAHIIPNTVLWNGRRYKGVFDLNDNNGFILKLLFRGVPSVRIVCAYCHVSQEWFVCAIQTTPLNSITNFIMDWHILTSEMTWRLFHYENDNYITTVFPAFNQTMWNFLRESFGLRVITGYDESTIEIKPGLFSYWGIFVRGYRNIYDDTIESEDDFNRRRS